MLVFSESIFQNVLIMIMLKMILFSLICRLQQKNQVKERITLFYLSKKIVVGRLVSLHFQRKDLSSCLREDPMSIRIPKEGEIQISFSCKSIAVMFTEVKRKFMKKTILLSPT